MLRRLTLAPLAQPRTVRNLFTLAGRRTPLYSCTFMNTVAPEDQRNNPLYVAAVVSFCIPDTNINRADKAINVCVQAMSVGFTENLPSRADTVAQMGIGLKTNYPSLPVDVKRGINNGEEPAYVTNAGLAPTEEEILLAVASLATNGDLQSAAIQIFTTGVLAYTKQGNVTNNVLNKVTQAIRDTLSATIHLDPNVIRGVWNMVGPQMDAEKARVMLGMWEQAIGAECLRLRLLVQQAGWVGMTNYQNILRAKDLFPTFPWGRLAGVCPQDFTNFQRAITAVAGDKYYGYNNDLGDAKSTLYPTLAYCAYELLVSVQGDRSLRDFQGTNRNTPNAAAVEKLVRDFEVAHKAELLNEDKNDPAAATAFLALSSRDVPKDWTYADEGVGDDAPGNNNRGPRGPGGAGGGGAGGGGAAAAVAPAPAVAPAAPAPANQPPPRPAGRGVARRDPPPPPAVVPGEEFADAEEPQA